MSYNTDHLRTAGKITVYTTFIGVVVFAIVFIFNLGESQIKQADAQSTASTTVIVVNTPPAWTASTTEIIESSITNPTNAGDVISWKAIGTDSNSEDYWLLICDTSAMPTSTSGGAPRCTSGVQWAVSGTTTSGSLAVAATTTLDGWAESNAWYSWICDGNAGNPRCSVSYSQGVNATNSSPFEVNHRPTFTAFSDPVTGIPGQAVTFYSTSTDNDTSGGAQFDQVFLTVCSVAGFSTTTNSCNGPLAVTLATSTIYVDDDASASYTIIIPTQDTDFGVYPYIIDNHGFEASGGEQGQVNTLTVNNVAPTVSGTSISLTQPITNDIVLINESSETTGFTLSFVASDNNSCDAFGGLDDDEITDYNLSIYRTPTGNSSTTCTSSSIFDPNDCYPSDIAPTSWNLVCTASSTTCSGSSDSDILYECTFPMWYIADPTGSTTASFYTTDDWRAQVQGIDDDTAVGAYAESTVGVDVLPLLAFNLTTIQIPYGALEPGQKNEVLTATTTMVATGNVGLDKDVTGSSMCSTYTNASPCIPSLTATIPEYEQVFATSSVAYTTAEGLGNTLSSTTPKEIEINIPKSTSTSTPAQRDAYWGIRVPGTITFAGAYTGQNTFTALVGEPLQW